MRLALVSTSKIRQIPLSLLYLGSWIKVHSNHDVRIVDGSFEDPLQVLLSEDFDMVGFTAMTDEYESACRVAAYLKAVKPNLLTVIGGVHITALPDSQRPCFDYVITGLGEATLLNRLDGVITPHLSWEEIPLDWDLINPRYFRPSFHAAQISRSVTASLMTSRGCPYRCYFFSSGVVTDHVHSYSPRWVVNELTELSERSVDLVVIFDDVFTLSLSRLREIERLKREAGLDSLKLTCNARVNHFSDETAEVLKALNVTQVLFGFESGNPRILKLLKRDTATVDQAYDAITRAKQHGLTPVGGLIFGAPTETYSEMLDTVRFSWKCYRLGCSALPYAKLTPYPGTPAWRTSESLGTVSPHMDFDRFRYTSKSRIPVSIRLAMSCIRAPMFLRKVWNRKRL